MNHKILYKYLFRKRYAQLIIYKAYADLIAEAKKYFVGYAWWIIVPVFDMIIYYIVFGLFLKKGTTDFVPFLLSGILAWRWFSSTVLSGASSIIQNKSLMNRVFIPKIVFPMVVLISNTFKFIITLLFLFMFLWLSGYPINQAYLLLPIVVIIQFLLISFFTFVTAAILPFYPDLKIVVDSILRFMFFLSGIFYSVSNLSPKLQSYIIYNPMVHILTSYRKILIYKELPDMMALMIIGILSLIGIIISYILMDRYEYHYPKIL